MYNVLDANMLGIPGSYKELIPLAAKHGFEGVNVPKEALTDPAACEDAAQMAQAYGMKWGLLPTPVDFFHEGVGEDALAEALKTLEGWAAAGEKLGVKYSYNHVWPTSSSKKFDENFAWHVERLKRIQEVFQKHGILYGFEFLGPAELRENGHQFVHTISGVLAIADAAGGASGFLFDTYHWYCGSRRPDDLYFAAQNCGRMVNLHLNDGVAGLAPDEQKDMVREMPMTTGIIDSASVYRLFRENGYQGPAMCEPMNPTTGRFAGQPAEQSVEEAAQAFARVR